MKKCISIIIIYVLVSFSNVWATGIICEIKNTGLRYSDSKDQYFLTVTGVDDKGNIIYKEKSLKRKSFYTSKEYYWIDANERFSRSFHHIIFEKDNVKYVIGDMEKIKSYSDNKKMNFGRIEVPWSFNLETQKFCFNFKCEDLPFYDGKIKEFSRKFKIDKLDRIKFNALSGEKISVDKLKMNNMWN